MSFHAALNVVLVEPLIPPNTGSIARLCAATGTTLHLIKPLGFKVDDKHLKRAGLDYWPLVHIVYWENVADFLANQDPDRLYFLSKKVSRPYTENRFRPGDFIVFGKETIGLPQELLDKYPDRCCTIPILNHSVRSLNLAMCAGIVLYEALRQMADNPYDQR